MRLTAAIALVSGAALFAACGGPPGADGVGNMAPRARLSAPLSAPTATAVALDASASFDPDGSIVEYTFSFSDGTPQVTQATPVIAHSFADPGAYEVAVVVRDDGGALARATQLVVVRNDAPSCSAAQDCALGTECRDRLCYATAASAGTGVADCDIDSDCGTGLTCRAGLCLTAQAGAQNGAR